MSIKKIFIGTFLSLAASFVFMCFLAVVVYFANISDRTVGAVIFVLSAVSVFLGAFFLARNISSRGLLNGLMLAAFYFAVLIVISLLVNGSVEMSASNFLRLASILASGALGGILGINTGMHESAAP